MKVNLERQFVRRGQSSVSEVLCGTGECHRDLPMMNGKNYRSHICRAKSLGRI
jgi:hypothetical protein